MTRRRGRLPALVLGLALAATLITAAPASAAWNDGEVAGGTVTAGRVLAPTNFTCVADRGILSSAFVFNWQAPATTGLVRTKYRIEVRGGITGGWDVDASATSFRLSAGLLGIGSGTATITAYSGTWNSDPAAPGSRALSATTSLLISCG